MIMTRKISFTFILYLCLELHTVVERPLMLQWVVGSIPHGGPIELIKCVECIINQRLWYVLSCLRTLAANLKE